MKKQILCNFQVENRNYIKGGLQLSLSGTRGHVASASEMSGGGIDVEAVRPVPSLGPRAQAILIGPGMGDDRSTGFTLLSSNVVVSTSGSSFWANAAP